MCLPPGLTHKPNYKTSGSLAMPLVCELLALPTYDADHQMHSLILVYGAATVDLCISRYGENVRPGSQATQRLHVQMLSKNVTTSFTTFNMQLHPK